MPQQCPHWTLLFFEAEVIAAGAFDFAFAPFQLLDGSAEHGEVGNVFSGSIPAPTLQWLEERKSSDNRWLHFFITSLQ